VALQPNGRAWSEQLELEFGTDTDGFLWIYTSAGERLLDHAELDRLAADERERRQEAEARATEEYRRREAETRRRQEAGALAAAEARQRQEAERRATEAESRAAQEAARREELE
jgi:hypothetical protein